MTPACPLNYDKILMILSNSTTIVKILTQWIVSYWDFHLVSLLPKTYIAVKETGTTRVHVCLYTDKKKSIICHVNDKQK